MTSSERSALLARDRLSPGAIEPLRKQVMIISPTVSRRPGLDVALGDIATLAQFNLECMRVRAQENGEQLDEDGIKDFRNYCEITFKQARLEMAVEKHIEERASGLDPDESSEGIVEAMSEVLLKFNIKLEVVEALIQAVLKKLGLDE
jgi:hypothetical protein